MSDLENFFDTHTHHFHTNEGGIVQITDLSPGNFPTWFSYGIHPKDADSQPDTNDFKKLANNPDFLAVGEIGLDNRYGNAGEAQEKVFIPQLKIAADLQKPVILHCVNSWDRCRSLHQKYAPETPLIYHGFNKASIVDQVLEYKKSMISIGASIISNIKLQNTVKNVPMSRLLAETDDSDMSIREVYQKLAEIKSLSLRDFSEQIRENVKQIFGI